MPSLLAEQRIGIEYAPITNVTEEREAGWRIILRIYIKTQKTKTKNKGNNTAADTATHFVQLSCPLFSQPALELSSAFRKQWEGGRFVT